MITLEYQNINLNYYKTARDNYKVRKILNEIFDKKFFEALNDPGYIIDKYTALTVCNALIKICVDRAGMKEGSIMHLMGRRLMNYIELQESPGKK